MVADDRTSKPYAVVDGKMDTASKSSNKIHAHKETNTLLDCSDKLERLGLQSDLDGAVRTALGTREGGQQTAALGD